MLPSTPPVRRRTRIGNRPAVAVCGAIGIAVLFVVVGVAVFGDESDETARTPREAAKEEMPVGGETPSDSRPNDASTPTTESSVKEPVVDAEQEAPPEPFNIDRVQANISMTQGDCSWDPATTDLRSSGTLVNRNPDGHRVYISVTWHSADGTELNGAADQWYVDAGGELMDWELVSYWDEAPSGLRCDVTVEVLF
ncbi:MAG: hypothetical protein EXQ69_10945 [Acidimicrobiia bacterium]|nr:hypothetical protein [Acidimicrobiia bacterium]